MRQPRPTRAQFFQRSRLTNIGLTAGFFLAGAAVACAERTATPLRDVRVLIANGADRVRIQSDAPIVIQPDQTGVSPTELHSNTLIEFRVRNNKLAASIATADLGDATSLLPASSHPITVSVWRNGQWKDLGIYPGSMRLVIDTDGKIDAINHVDVEDYVAGVVAAEAWPTFHDQALRGQAIVARSFVVYQMTRDPNAEIDLSATQGAQVYHGLRTDAVGRRVDDATDYTRGVVLVYRDNKKDRLFCAYYSAACGGRSQSAAPFGSASDVPPLRGEVSCDFCKIAPGDTYRWGPQRVALAKVKERLAARYPAARKLGKITAIDVATRTPSGRPLELQIRGSSGESFTLLAERFRQAIDPSAIKSTDFRIRIDGNDVVFDHGKGFGHGLGLCQWGMQGQAKKGKRAGEILRYYYPTARLVRVY